MTNGSSSSRKPARLGRGLSALVGTNPPVRVDAPQSTPDQRPIIQTNTESSTNSLLMLRLDDIRPNPQQPRRSFDESALGMLAESIRRDGVMQPVVVRAVVDGYELVAGERRLRASRLAGVETIPAVVREADDRTSAELALIENLQRADLNPVERAAAFRVLGDRYAMTHAQIGERVGMDRASVSNHLRLLDLEESILTMLAAGQLGFGHARALLAVEDPERRLALAKLASEESWSVRAVERAASEHSGERSDMTSGGVQEKTSSKNTQENTNGRARAVLDDMERRLSEHLGTRVTLRTDRSGQKGSLTLEFFSLDQFDGLLERLGYRHDVS